MSRGDTPHARRAELVLRAAAERDELAARLGPLERPARLVDRALAALAAIRRHPVVAGVVVAVVVAVRPKVAWRWAGRALVAWRFGRKALALLDKRA